MDLKSVPCHSPSVVTRKTGNEYVLVPIANNIADMDSVYTLNETGAFIWDQIDGKKNFEKIILLLIREFDVDEPKARTDLIEFIDKMKKFLIIE